MLQMPLFHKEGIMKKKILSMFLGAALAVSLAACGGGQSGATIETAEAESVAESAAEHKKTAMQKRILLTRLHYSL